MHLLFLHGALLPRLYQGCLPFSIQISSQMSFIQESISLPVIQSHSHLSSGSACHFSLFNYINRVYHCDEKQLVYFCRVNNSPFELLTKSYFCLAENKSWFFSRSIHLPIRMSSSRVAQKVSADIKLLEVKSQALILRQDYLNSSISFSL